MRIKGTPFFFTEMPIELQLEGASVDGKFVNALEFVTGVAELYREGAKQ